MNHGHATSQAQRYSTLPRLSWYGRDLEPPNDLPSGAPQFFYPSKYVYQLHELLRYMIIFFIPYFILCVYIYIYCYQNMYIYICYMYMLLYTHVTYRLHRSYRLCFIWFPM